ncbi:MAG: Dihydroorotase, multifunctional complex type [Parcubacteria group bacterium GW2011_GWA2_44_12]|nr:MAG: Dihydroorotase, multifunctional complex type [Parcubacteria group bacterium GW2011_GWA2_44_12]
MAIEILLKNTAFWESGERVDIAIAEGKIIAIEKDIASPADQHIDAEGKYVLPGLIDPHVHFRTPGEEYKEDWKTGTYAAAKGGVTTVFDMPNTNPPCISNALVAEKYFAVQAVSPSVDFRLYLGATKHNLHDIETTKAAGVKVYLGSSTGGLLLDDYTHLEAIVQASPVPVLVHAEDEACIQRNFADIMDEFEEVGWGKEDLHPEDHSRIRAEECAAVCVEKVLGIVERVQKPVYFCHVSTSAEIELLGKAKEKGLPVYVEVSPHHLFLSINAYSRLDNFVKVNPPLRDEKSLYKLWKALLNGTIDTIGSDHAPHTIAEKCAPFLECPSGVPGIETTLPLLLDAVNKKQLTLKKVVELTNLNPANIFGLYSKAGLKVGNDADMVLVDMDLEQRVVRENIASKCGWSPFEGQLLKGWPILTISRGKVVYKR